MKEVQSKYFVSKIMDKDTYESVIKEYSIRNYRQDRQMHHGNDFNEK